MKIAIFTLACLVALAALMIRAKRAADRRAARELEASRERGRLWRLFFSGRILVLDHIDRHAFTRGAAAIAARRESAVMPVARYYGRPAWKSGLLPLTGCDQRVNIGAPISVEHGGCKPRASK